jgi:hypothetical protein
MSDFTLFQFYTTVKRSGAINTPDEFRKSLGMSDEDFKLQLAKDLPEEEILSETDLELLPLSSKEALLEHSENYDPNEGRFFKVHPDDDFGLEVYDNDHNFVGWRNPTFAYAGSNKHFRKKILKEEEFHPQGLAKGGQVKKKRKRSKKKQNGNDIVASLYKGFK